MFKTMLGKFIFPIAIIGGIAGLALSIASMAMSINGISVWDMAASHASGNSKVDGAVNLSTYGAIGGAVISVLTLILASSLYREEFVTQKVRVVVLLLTCCFIILAIVFPAIVLDSSINVTDTSWLAEQGVFPSVAP